MTKIDDQTIDEIWEDIEDEFYGMYKDVKHRCYSKHSVTGARYIQVLVRRHLARIDYALLVMETRLAKKEPQIEQPE